MPVSAVSDNLRRDEDNCVWLPINIVNPSLLIRFVYPSKIPL